MRVWLTVYCAALVAACGQEATPVAEEKEVVRPNIVLVMVDDMGWSDLGSYGSEIATPSLDRLAGEGIRFTSFRNTSKCFTTRAALLSGQYAQDVGMHEDFPGIRNAATLGDVLQSVGYRTIMVGKHHSRANPYDMGFHHYWGLRDGASNHFNPGYQRPGEVKPAGKASKGERVFCFDAYCQQPWTPPKGYYSTDSYTDWSMELLDRYKGEDKPFFLYLSYQAPHDPLHAWPEDIAKYKGKYDAGFAAIADARYQRQLESGLISAGTHPRSAPTFADWDALSDEQKAYEAANMEVYAAMVDNVDQNVGRLLTYLQERGELDNTLFLFLSDNGASAARDKRINEHPVGTIGRFGVTGLSWANVSNTPFRYYKVTPYEGGINTPMIAWWPDGIANPGRSSDFSGHVVDFMTTFVDMTGAAYPAEMRGERVGPMRGESLMPVFRGEEVERDGAVMFQWMDGKAIVKDGWKLVRWWDKAGDYYGLDLDKPTLWQLFYLPDDATETNDLFASRPDKVAELRAEYAEWWNSFNPGEELPE